MTVLERYSGHSKCQGRLSKSLEFPEDVDVIGHEYWNLEDYDETEWAWAMDHTRHLFGNDLEWNKRKPITYNHFVVSINPLDNPTYETIRKLVQRWIAENPIIANAQIAAVYHRDPHKNITRAHLIINNTDLLSGFRIHFDKKANYKLQDTLQFISRDMDLHYFPRAFETDGDPLAKPHLHEPRASKTEKYSKGERFTIDAGRTSWKQEIRDCIDECVEKSDATLIGFIECVIDEGYQVIPTVDGQIMFVHKSSDSKKVKGSTLGDDYALDAIRKRLGDRTTGGA